MNAPEAGGSLPRPTSNKPPVEVRPTRPSDLPALVELGRLIYPAIPYSRTDFESQLERFPQGQLVAVDPQTGDIAGMAASLIVRWDDYAFNDNWTDFTDSGCFTNHDPEGRTLYGAEVMVHPNMRRRGVGKALYAARRELCRSLKLLRIRAGARIAGYDAHRVELSPQEYVKKVVAGELTDPTLTFQLKSDFHVIGVVLHYMRGDRKAGGHAAIIEWLNDEVATRADYESQPREFGPPPGPTR